MNHKELKEHLFKTNPQLKKEYDDLEQLYQLKSAIIQLRIEKNLFPRGYYDNRSSKIQQS